jgi:hypothetical protein
MTSAAATLFQYCQFRVREQDVEEFGYNGIGGRVLQEWVRRVWRSRAVPGEADSDFSEFMLGLVNDDPNRWPDPERFRQYRLFVSSIALVLRTSGEPPDLSPSANYLAARALEDSIALEDHRLMELLPSVLVELHAKCRADPGYADREEAPFITLGLMILAFLGQAEAGDPAALADRLIAEESEFHSETWAPEFLWDVTCFVSCHATWQKLVRAHIPAQHPSEAVVLVRDELLKPLPTKADRKDRRWRDKWRVEEV